LVYDQAAGRPQTRQAGKIPADAAAIVEEGYALGRPSRIQVTVSGQRVRVGGSGLVIAEGTLYI
jgi:predicted PhzF superfamily epimerase YddE/YHI9